MHYVSYFFWGCSSLFLVVRFGELMTCLSLSFGLAVFLLFFHFLLVTILRISLSTTFPRITPKAVPIFNIDKRPFAVLCAYSTGERTTPFVSGENSILESFDDKSLFFLVSWKVMSYPISGLLVSLVHKLVYPLSRLLRRLAWRGFRRDHSISCTKTSDDSG